ncbi:MAG: 30S ribosomal protein S27ae [Candidatus Micrarchaeota archaeon]
MAEEKKKKEFKPYKPPKLCPKCGSRMAEHEDRYTCGKCGYTEWKRAKKEADSTGKNDEEE